MAVGKEIKRLRDSVGLTGKQIADMLGVDYFRLNNWESKDFEPKADDRILIEQFFNMPLDEIKAAKVIPQKKVFAYEEGDPIIDDRKEKPNPKMSYSEKYRHGQRFGDVIDALRKNGFTLEYLRDTVFKIKGRELSKMYLGLKPIPNEIKNILITQFHANPEYFDTGKPPILLGNNLKTDKSSRVLGDKMNKTDKSFPYIEKLNKGLDFIKPDYVHTGKTICIPYIDVQAFINVFGDSMYPKLNAGDVLGIKQIQKENIMFGEIYLLQLNNNEVWLKYIMPGKDKNHWILKSENANYPPKEFKVSEISNIFLIKTIIVNRTLS